MQKTWKEVRREYKKNHSPIIIWGTSRYGMIESFQILKKRGIVVSAFCDSDLDFWGKEIVEGIICKKPDDLDTNDIIVIGVKSQKATNEIMNYLIEKGFDNIITYSELKKHLGYFGDDLKEKIDNLYKKVVGHFFHVDEWHMLSNADQRPYSIETYQLINQMKPLGKVVEVGCGLGDILVHIDAQDKVGFDINENVIKASKIIHPTLKTYVGSFEDIQNEKIEILYCVDVLHILPDDFFRKEYDLLLKRNKIENLIVDSVPAPPYENSHEYVTFFAEYGYHLEYESRPFLAYGTAKRRILLFKKDSL